MARTLVDFREVTTFMEGVLPATMPARDRRTAALRFYSWLSGHGVREFGFAFFCPHCKDRRGECICPQLGHKWDGPGSQDWVYEVDILALIQWRLDARTVLRLDPLRLNRESTAMHRRLAQFITFLKAL